MALVEKAEAVRIARCLVVGGRAFTTSQILQKNCHEFIAYENLVGRRAGPRGRPQDTPLTGAVTLVRRALKVLTNREVSPRLGVLKSTLLQLNPTFSEREYRRRRVPRPRPAAGIRYHYDTRSSGTDRSLYVELREGSDGAPSPRESEPAAGIAAAPRADDAGARARSPPARSRPPLRWRHPARSRSSRTASSATSAGAAAGVGADLDELDAAAYAAAHGMPPPSGRRPRRRDGRDAREDPQRRERDGRDRGARDRDGGRGQATQGGAEKQAARRRRSPMPHFFRQADGYRAMERVLAWFRWPLYLRQAIAGDEGFDERK